MVEVIIGNEVVGREKMSNTIEVEDEVEVEVEATFSEDSIELSNYYNEGDESRNNHKKRKSSKGKIWKKYRDNIDGRKIKKKNELKSEKSPKCDEENKKEEIEDRKVDNEKEEEEENESYHGDPNDVHRYVRHFIKKIYIFFHFICMTIQKYFKIIKKMTSDSISAVF